jgi:xanthine dehydrogenase YagT iron-sulfur-binding subunit
MNEDIVSGEKPISLKLLLNSHPLAVEVSVEATLLDLVRDQLGLTGTKKGCDMGACGACTVLANERSIKSCLVLAGSCEGMSITTIEGIGSPENLHPLQAAFIRHDALQCGYCTPGQILAGIALLRTQPKSIEIVREAMSGNLCRCGAHPNIVAAIAEVGGL